MVWKRRKAPTPKKLVDRSNRRSDAGFGRGVDSEGTYPLPMMGRIQ